jgi:O-antigen ligase
VPAFSERIASVTSVSSATQQTGTDANADQSTQGRATEMAAAAQVFVDHPVLGVGPGNFPLYYREYAERIGGEIHDAVSSGKNKGAQAERQAHNMYISQLAELGLLGSLPFFAILIGVSVALGRTRKLWVRRGERENADLATILLLSVISYLFCALFLTLAFERYFWLLLGIAGAATSLALRDPDRVPDRT